MIYKMKNEIHFPKSIRQDFLASIVVFLVALPLCMGIAMASGVPPVYGIISGIIGGLVAGYFTGAPLVVSGPAAGLTVLVWEIVQQYGIASLGVIVLVAGLLQWLAGRLAFGQWFRASSPAVIQGMLTGIGVLIFASQFHVMVGDKPGGKGIDNLLSIPQALWNGLNHPDMSSHFLAAALGVFTIASLLIWQSKIMPKKLKMIPAPLIAIVLATLIANLGQFPVQFITLPENIFSSLQSPLDLFQKVNLLANPAVWGSILGLALIASAETLLSASAADQMHQGPRTNYDKELSAQGIGNMTCGLLGVLPITGVIVRSATNIQAGAVSNKSAMMHGLWLLSFIFLAPGVLRLIPTATLAALLVYTGYKLMNFKIIPKLLQYGKWEVVVFAATILTIVVEDLLTGVVVGLVLSAIKLLFVFSHLEIRITQVPEAKQAHVYLRGAATFLRLPQLASTLERLSCETEVHVHLEELRYIDHACLDLIVNWEKQHQAMGGHLVIDWESLHLRVQQPASSVSAKR